MFKALESPEGTTTLETVSGTVVITQQSGPESHCLILSQYEVAEVFDFLGKVMIETILEHEYPGE